VCDHNHLAFRDPLRQQSDPIGPNVKFDHEDARAACAFCSRIASEERRGAGSASGAPQWRYAVIVAATREHVWQSK